MRLRLALLCCSLLAPILFSKSAQAQIGCPEGYIPIGGQDVHGCAPIHGYPSGGSTRRSEPTIRIPPPDPGVLLLKTALERQRFETQFGKILFSDPTVGVWLMTSAGDGTGKKCVVSFVAMGATNTVSFFGPHENRKGAILFQSLRMPATREIREIQPTLTFKGANPIPLNAALMPYGENSGILLPTDMVEMMRQANAENEITLHLDNQEVLRASMTGFMTARSAMLNCMQAE